MKMGGKSVKVTSQVIEREMNEASRANFKKFLVKFFGPENSTSKDTEMNAEIGKDP